MTAAEASISEERLRLLEERVRELTFLHETNRLLTATLDVDAVVRSLTTQVRDYFRAEAVCLALRDEEDDGLTLRISIGEASDSITELRLPLGTGVAGWVIQEGKSTLISDARSDSRFCSIVDERTGLRTKSALAAAINTDRGTIGAVEVLNPPVSMRDAAALEVLTRVADHAALAISNAERFELARHAVRRYESLFESSPLPVLVMDLNTEILNVNRQAVELMGRPADELIGSYWCDLLDEERITCQRLFRDLPESGWSSTEMEVPSPKGLRTLSVRMTAIDYGGKRAVQWIGHDITDLTQLERMRDDLVHMIVHDLRNPLSNIVGSLQLMHQAVREEDRTFPTLDVLQVAMRSSDRMRRLIDSLLDLRQLEADKADLNRIMVPPELLTRKAVASVQSVIEKKGQVLSIDVPGNLPPVSVDRDMMTRVLTNLLDNAAKYTPTNGRIALAVEQERKSLLFIVSDNGPGISPDAQEHIFERFARLESTRRTKGSGLGLPFCKLAVEAHGGDIWVDSALGEGSQFTVKLPLEVP